MSDTLNTGAVKSSTVENDNPSTLIGSPSSSDQTKPDYGLDANSELEDSAGTKRTVGTTLAAVDANTAKTTDLSEDGSKYTGDVSGADVTSTDGKTEDTVAGVLQRTLDTATATEKLTAKTADLSADGSQYTGDVSSSTITSEDGKAKFTGGGLVDQVQNLSKTLGAQGQQLSDLSGDGSLYSGDVSGAIGGVKVQTAPADLTAAPTEADFNSLLASLKAAGVLK